MDFARVFGKDLRIFRVSENEKLGLVGYRVFFRGNFAQAQAHWFHILNIRAKQVLCEITGLILGSDWVFCVKVHYNLLEESGKNIGVLGVV